MLHTIEISDFFLDENPVVIGVSEGENDLKELEYFQRDTTLAIGHFMRDNFTTADDVIDFFRANETKRVRIAFVKIDSKLFTDLAENYTRVRLYVIPREGDQVHLEGIPMPECVTRIMSTDTNLALCVLDIFGYVQTPILPEGRAKHVNAKFIQNYIHEITELTSVFGNRKCQASIDCNGHVVIRSDKPIWDMTEKTRDGLAEALGVSQREADSISFCGVDFVTISKRDAMALAEILDKVCVERDPDCDSQVAFGSAGISYERLHDAIQGATLWATP